MAKPTRLQAIQDQVIAALATIVSGKNPDGTDFTLSVATTTAGGSETLTTIAAAVPVTTTSATAIAANAARMSLVIVNNGASDVTIRRAATAVAGQGIVLKANGGSYEINSTNLYKGVISCITATGTSTLAIEEGV